MQLGGNIKQNIGGATRPMRKNRLELRREGQEMKVAKKKEK